MNLNDLKPAWSQLKFQNSMLRMEQNEVLEIIESQKSMASLNLHRVVSNTVIFSILVIFCQGG
ncbi:MAG: hypothetical protein KDC79_00430 [Cyclobacteriaceae bacterium]|nr:hypothetical protein [Cyclobacteriaceae bacterium]